MVRSKVKNGITAIFYLTLYALIDSSSGLILNAIRCAPGIGPRSGPVPHLHK